ncbi:uncharacterized protein LOC105252908 isoform X1 [Camponotus floridanus]|nr:uncharacterized protein LOC105252908 isoform X1 [Camponotus floridanus]XP_011258865.1 uncharacterized protein LOC105252908 isoform X1 [Camponotus floridanus]
MNQQIHNSAEYKPPIPKGRKSYQTKKPEEKNFSYMYNSSKSMDNKFRKETSNLSENDILLKDDSINDKQIKESFDEHIKENKEEFAFQNDTSSEEFKHENSPHLSINKQDTKTSEKIYKQDTKTSEKINKQDTKINNKICSNFFMLILVISFVLCAMIWSNFNNKTNAAHSISQFKSIEEIKAKFYNQESDIWNDISSAINEIESRNPKIPQIILLFANETTTMNCLATALADVSSIVLGINDPLHLNPENFGNDAGEIIEKLKQYSEVKKIVRISNILNINAEAIQALHNLCDKENPLIKEVLYIFTMQTNNNQSSQQKLKFVEDQFYHKLSKNIDRDTLGALVTRITDAAIISVQPEPHLRYCNLS